MEDIFFTFFVSHFEISGICTNNEQLKNKFSKLVILDIFQIDSSDISNNEALQKNIFVKSDIGFNSINFISIFFLLF